MLAAVKGPTPGSPSKQSYTSSSGMSGSSKASRSMSPLTIYNENVPVRSVCIDGDNGKIVWRLMLFLIVQHVGCCEMPHPRQSQQRLIHLFFRHVGVIQGIQINVTLDDLQQNCALSDALSDDNGKIVWQLFLSCSMLAIVRPFPPRPQHRIPNRQYQQRVIHLSFRHVGSSCTYRSWSPVDTCRCFSTL